MLFWQLAIFFSLSLVRKGHKGVWLCWDPEEEYLSGAEHSGVVWKLWEVSTNRELQLSFRPNSSSYYRIMNLRCDLNLNAVL